MQRDLDFSRIVVVNLAIKETNSMIKDVKDSRLAEVYVRHPLREDDHGLTFDRPTLYGKKLEKPFRSEALLDCLTPIFRVSLRETGKSLTPYLGCHSRFPAIHHALDVSFRPTQFSLTRKPWRELDGFDFHLIPLATRIRLHFSSVVCPSQFRSI